MFKQLRKQKAKASAIQRAVVLTDAKGKINGVPGGAIVEGRYGVWSR